MKTKEMNIKELEKVNGGEDYGTILLKPNPPIPRPIEIPQPVTVIEGSIVR